jgi:hypothetical protein
MGIQVLCCWPGLASLWHRGVPRSLLLAVLCCWAVGLLLLATFVWPDWIDAWIVRSCWLLALVAWIAGSVRSHLNFSRMMGRPDDNAQSAFVQAQNEYLKGNWFEAEAILLDILHDFPRDAEAMLMLVGVLRHTQRWQPALRRLDQLELLDTAAPWRFEILHERKIIQNRISETQEAALMEVVSDCSQA